MKSRRTRRPKRAGPVIAAGARAPEWIGVDTGGTFTDFVGRVGGRWRALKLPSTPAAPERAVLEGLLRLGAGSGTRIRHGSTVATNTLLERKGARVTFVTTRGFEDLLEIGRQDRPQLYALQPRRVAPLVPAERRIGARERLDPAGRAKLALGPAEARRVARSVRRTRPEAVAVGLLHAYASDRHERRLARALETLGLPVTYSAALCPEFREYERFATTVTNAYLLPRLSGYLEALARGTRAELEIVLSHGGTAPPAEAAREPVRQLLSGPAGGLAAAAVAARDAGFARALTLDVGGTSTDVAYVEGDELPRRRSREVAGFPVLLPMLDVHTVGAGGGSIASVDAGGLPRVGPESAGAAPGPACYGRGGPATVTDALLMLGRIPLRALGGGALPLDREAAARAISRFGRSIARPRREEAASAILSLAEARMAAALRAVSVERGHDPRGAALVAFGGAGGLHACALAEALECEAVVFPAHAGVLSALGALLGGSRRERSRSVLLDALDRSGIARELRRLRGRVLGELLRPDRPSARVSEWAEVRYRGQSHELTLPVTGDLVERFHRAHQRRFGFAARHQSVEVVTLEVRAAVPARLGAIRSAKGAPAGPASTHAWIGGRAIVVPVHDFERLPRRLRGPCVVLQEGATLWVAPAWSGERHRAGALVLRRGRR